MRSSWQRDKYEIPIRTTEICIKCKRGFLGKGTQTCYPPPHLGRRRQYVPLILRQRQDMSTSFKECHSNVRRGPRSGPRRRRARACEGVPRAGQAGHIRTSSAVDLHQLDSEPPPQSSTPILLLSHGRENKTRSPEVYFKKRWKEQGRHVTPL